MEPYKIEIIETILVIIGYIGTRFLSKILIKNTLESAHLQGGRRKMIVKALNLFYLLTLTILLSAVWGIKQHDIAVFIGTIVTALGIAFFAQWSLLSNITSSLLLFFNHPIKVGDQIKLLDKDYPFEGEVTDLTYFFVYLKTDCGDIVTIPNSLLLQKSIVIIETNKV